MGLSKKTCFVIIIMRCAFIVCINFIEPCSSMQVNLTYVTSFLFIGVDFLINFLNLSHVIVHFMARCTLMNKHLSA